MSKRADRVAVKKSSFEWVWLMSSCFDVMSCLLDI